MVEAVAEMGRWGQAVSERGGRLATQRVISSRGVNINGSERFLSPGTFNWSLGRVKTTRINTDRVSI